MASNPVTSIPEERLLRARNFKEFCKYPWGNLAFDYLRKEVESFTYTKLTEKDQYAICGFIYPLQLWALSSVNQLGTFFDVDSEFGRVVDLVKRGYRLKRQDWLNGSVDIAVAEAEVDENNSAPRIDATDQEKIEFLTKKVVSLEEKVEYLEGLLNIRRETVKETEKSKETEAATKTKGKKNGVRPPREVDHQEEDDTETQEEDEQQQEDDTEVNADVDVGAKESENPETNEDGEMNEDASKKPVKVTKKRGRGNKGNKKSVKPPREVQQQVEDDAEIGAKESENPETNEDGEMNGDASKKPVKVTKKHGRENKGMKKGVTPPYEVQQQVEDDAEVDAKESENPETNEDGEMNEDAFKKPVKVTKKYGRGNKGMKKGVTPPYEVQQQVEDDAEVDAKESENPETNEDGEMNEDAFKKPVKVTKKYGRGNKGMKKGVTPPCEVQQQVEDDAKIGAKESANSETNEDGEVNDDASNKPVKFTKKLGRGNKEPNVDTSKSKRQKKQEDSAGDVIGRVLEDLKKPIRSMANIKK
ncbi:hypothetical protein DY000_02048539 [Brassica cretica]|uniref:DUF1985 domain-containing protein n=1 Tax=Brassica cretica TaxID=69181 RepID=A0ABQ7F2Q7_BRACR|nr:hypothetical protein DY000_02048539 [Brassica cretica]